jgi:hypothetical protein
MRNLFPKTFLVTSIAVGALWAGTLRAQVADFVQVNLVSDLPGLATITDPELVNPWGGFAQLDQPILDLEPGEEYRHSLRRYRQHQGQQGAH